MNKKKIAKDILFSFFLIMLIITYFILINYHNKNSKIEISSEIAKWSFGLNNSETAIKLSEEKIYPGCERKV